jgi:hypothetical protein
VPGTAGIRACYGASMLYPDWYDIMISNNDINLAEKARFEAYGIPKIESRQRGRLVSLGASSENFVLASTR